MFPPSCARVRMHTGREKSARKKTGGWWWTKKLGAHYISFEKCFLHIFLTPHSKFRWVMIKCCTKEILCTHRLWKIRGNIAP